MSNDQHGVVCGYHGSDGNAVNERRATAATIYGLRTNNLIGTLSMLVGDGRFRKIDNCVENDDPDRRTREKPAVGAYPLSVDLKHVPT